VELKILGSNSAAFAHGRHHTAQLLIHHSKYFLIDCGEGTQIQLKRYKVKLSKIHAIFISHLHGDHYFGLTGLLNTFHLFGRKEDLLLVGPPGLKEIVSLQLHYSQSTLSYAIRFTEYRPEEIHTVFETDKLTVSTIPLDHRIPCSGYLFREKPKLRRIIRQAIPDQLIASVANRLKRGDDIVNPDGSLRFKNDEVTMPPIPAYSYAFCSDTRYNPRILPQIQGVDLLYHEASFLDDMGDRAGDTYHSTARQAADIARQANVGKLLLGHFSSRYRELEGFLNESREVFQNTEIALEGRTFVVGEQNRNSG
jgi:ribonuclease Z